MNRIVLATILAVIISVPAFAKTSKKSPATAERDSAPRVVSGKTKASRDLPSYEKHDKQTESLRVSERAEQTYTPPMWSGGSFGVTNDGFGFGYSGRRGGVGFGYEQPRYNDCYNPAPRVNFGFNFGQFSPERFTQSRDLSVDRIAKQSTKEYDRRHRR